MKSPNSLLLKKRLKKLVDYLAEQKLEGCIVQAPIDLYYLTGLELSLGSLCVFKGKGCLFVDGRYIQSAKEKCPIEVEQTEEKKIRAFAESSRIQSIAFDAQGTSYTQFEKLNLLFPKIKLVPVNGLLRELRLVKDAYELAAMRKSAALLWKGYLHIKKKLKTGITELALAREFEIFSRLNGAEKLAFDPIIAFGKNSAMPHYHPADTKLKKGDTVLIDIGVSVDGYHSDMTRTLFFGTPDPRLKKWAEIVREAHDAALKICKPGIKAGELDEAARKVMRREKVEEYFLHSLGHGIGLETHESPRLKFNGEDKNLLLKPGMIITIEPGLYLAGKGGIRHENTIILTKSGHENLYKGER